MEALSAEIARLDSVDVDTLDEVLEEFRQLAQARQYYVQGGVNFAEEVLVATMGQDKAHEVMQRLTASLVEMPFEFLRLGRREADPVVPAGRAPADHHSGARAHAAGRRGDHPVRAGYMI